MILECLVTTLDAAGQVNVAPMGPSFPDSFDWNTPVGQTFQLRPFQPSQTLANLQRHPAGVLNLVDDVRLFVLTALNLAPGTCLPMVPAAKVLGQRLEAAGRCFEFSANHWTQQGPRWTADCCIEAVHEQRPMIQFNRARHAVIEATILATRVSLLPAESVRQQVEALQPLIDKTAGPPEREAWEMLQTWLRNHYDNPTTIREQHSETVTGNPDSRSRR